MNALIDEGIVARDTTQFVDTVDATSSLIQVNLRGRVVTASGAIVIVNKWLAVQRSNANRYLVMTSEYDYHAYQPGDPRCDLFRYDSCHGIDTLHVHRFDTDGVERPSVDYIEVGAMPLLNDVIREADLLGRWLAEYRSS